MFGSSCLYLPLFITRLMSCLHCFPYDARFVFSLPPVVYSKADVLFALFSVRCSVRLFFRFDAFFYVRQAIKTAARDLVLHGIISQSNRPSIINGIRFYDCCSNINCRLSRSRKASNINFT